jgi:hypothetical protein
MRASTIIYVVNTKYHVFKWGYGEILANTLGSNSSAYGLQVRLLLSPPRKRKMSEKFIEVFFPCEECLIKAICSDYKYLHNKDDIIASPWLMVFPKPTEKSPRKLAFECCFNFINRIVSYTESKDDVVSIDFIIEIGNLLEYLINSRSWKDNVMYDFDRLEISSRLRRCMNWMHRRKELDGTELRIIR